MPDLAALARQQAISLAQALDDLQQVLPDVWDAVDQWAAGDAELGNLNHALATLMDPLGRVVTTLPLSERVALIRQLSGD